MILASPPGNGLPVAFAKNQVNHSEIIGKLKYSIVTAGSGRVALISKTGEVLWQHRGANTTDAQMLPNKNVLFSDGRSVTEVNKKNEVVFQYISDSKHRGDATLFARRDEVEEAWKFIDHIERAWHESKHPPKMEEYVAGTWGPKESDDLLAQDGHKWRRL